MRRLIGAVLVLMALVMTASAAQNLKGGVTVATDITSTATVKMGQHGAGEPAAGKPANVGEGYSKAKEWFEETKKKVQEARQQAEEKRFEAWKKHLLAWVEVGKRWVERVELRVENLNLGNDSKERLMNKLQEIESRFTEIESKIESAQNYTELRDTTKEIKWMWGELKQEMRHAVHGYAIEKYQEILERLKQVRDRLEAVGLNVSELNEKIDEIEQAVAELEDSVGTPEFADKVREINGLFREAFGLVKELSREARYEYHTGFVYAHVNGSFELSGNFSLVQIKGEGDVTIPENVVVTSVDTPGVRMIVARGNFTASGEGEFRILAHGSGELVLNGEGYYRVKQTPTSPVTDEIEFEGEKNVTFG